eukprot:13301344-Alexandrium_andersonii.AAC.1
MDSHRQVRIMEACEGKRSFCPTLGKCPWKFLHVRDFRGYPVFGFTEEPAKMMHGPRFVTRFHESGEFSGDRVPG